MNERDLTLEEIQEAAAQPTRELQEVIKSLSFWLENVHHPSEGGYIEYAVRSYLRKRIPRRFEVSTGFISTLQKNVVANNQSQISRRVSRQFDILIWDSYTFPPLFRADDFVILAPEAVKVIIEVTKSLDSDKLSKDLGKFDDLLDFYSGERLLFKPYTAILALSGSKLIKSLQNLERFYLFESKISVLFRYLILDSFLRAPYFRLNSFLSLPGFVDSVCILNQGLIKGQFENLKFNLNQTSVVRYYALNNQNSTEVTFGCFERDIIFYLSESAAQLSGFREVSIDIYRELIQSNLLLRPFASIIIENWASKSIMPSINAWEKLSRRSLTDCPEKVENVSRFVGADFSINHPRPIMYVEEFSNSNSEVWVFEKHSSKVFASGRYKDKNRVKKWHVFNIDKDCGISEEKITEINKFDQTIDNFKMSIFS